MTAKEYLKNINFNDDDVEIINIIQSFAEIKWKEIENYYDNEVEKLFMSSKITEKEYREIRLNSPFCKTN